MIMSALRASTNGEMFTQPVGEANDISVAHGASRGLGPPKTNQAREAGDMRTPHGIMPLASRARILSNHINPRPGAMGS